jgi:hypothetical protein
VNLEDDDEEHVNQSQDDSTPHLIQRVKSDLSKIPERQSEDSFGLSNLV